MKHQHLHLLLVRFKQGMQKVVMLDAFLRDARIIHSSISFALNFAAGTRTPRFIKMLDQLVEMQNK